MCYDFEILVSDSSSAEVSIATAMTCNCTFRGTYCTFCCNTRVSTLKVVLRVLACSELILNARNEKFRLQTIFLGNHVYIILHSNWKNGCVEVNIWFLHRATYNIALLLFLNYCRCRLYSDRLPCNCAWDTPTFLLPTCTMHARVYFTAEEVFIQLL